MLSNSLRSNKAFVNKIGHYDQNIEKIKIYLPQIITSFRCTNIISVNCKVYTKHYTICEVLYANGNKIGQFRWNHK